MPIKHTFRIGHGSDDIGPMWQDEAEHLSLQMQMRSQETPVSSARGRGKSIGLHYTAHSDILQPQESKFTPYSHI